MTCTIEIPDAVLSTMISNLLIDRNLLREALERAFAREKLTEILARALSTKIDDLLLSVVDGGKLVDCLKLAVADSVEEAIAKTIELLGEERIQEMTRAATRKIGG